jgi:hypothetical protein
MSETIEQIMERIKNLKEFTVEVDLPDDFVLHGSVPFDTKISGRKANFKVFGSSYDDAQSKVNDYIKSQH